MKKRVAVPGWFGEITPEEIEAIRGKYAEFEKKITEYQKRPIEKEEKKQHENIII